MSDELTERIAGVCDLSSHRPADGSLIYIGAH